MQDLFAKEPRYLERVLKIKDLLGNLGRQLTKIPFWERSDVSLEDLAVLMEMYDYYRYVSIKSTFLVKYVGSEDFKPIY